MGLRGPKVKHPDVLRLANSPLAKGRPAGPAIGGQGEPDMPSYLDDSAQAIWRELCPMLAEAGVLCRADGNSLARYCVCVARWRRLVEVLRREGETYEFRGATAARPETKICSQLANEMHRLEQAFGMSPLARPSLKIEKPVEDPFAALMTERSGAGVASS